MRHAFGVVVLIASSLAATARAQGPRAPSEAGSESPADRRDDGTTADAGVPEVHTALDAPDAEVAPLDAGAVAPDAGPATTPAPEPPETALAEPEPDAAPEAGATPARASPPPEPTIVPVPVPTVEPDLVGYLFPVLPEGGPWTTAGLVVLLLLALLLSGAVRRMRDRLPHTGLLPRALELVHTAVRLGIFLIALGVIAHVLPRSFAPGLTWALLAAAAAIGWSARDVLPDLLAGIVLFFERRVRPGVWLTAAGHSGIVETCGLRAVWLRDMLGHRIALPNRLLLGNAVVSQPEGAFHDVSVRLEARGVPAARLRQALRDAVLTSPWVKPEAGGVVRRDGQDPSLWHVRAQLLDVRFAVSFEGDLLERAEEMLEANAARRDLKEDWD